MALGLPLELALALPNWTLWFAGPQGPEAYLRRVSCDTGGVVLGSVEEECRKQLENSHFSFSYACDVKLSVEVVTELKVWAIGLQSEP